MLTVADDDLEAVRFSTADSLDRYVSGSPPIRTEVSFRAALEESFFLGLRLTNGVDLAELAAKFGNEALGDHAATVRECVGDSLLELDGDRIRLTPRGRLLSNEVFEALLAPSRIIL
jgi:oxygen-independent coproporphyrinogen-3 oxidase